MDDYDLRRLRSYENKTLRLSQDELFALSAVDPTIPADDLNRLAGRCDGCDDGYASGEGGL